MELPGNFASKSSLYIKLKITLIFININYKSVKIMTLNKIKKSSKQRLSFPQSLNSSPNSSFIMNGLKKS